MKVKYLATLTTASILSLGLVTSCATPEGGESNTTSPAEPGVTEVDPCAGVDPGAGVESGAEVDPVPTEDPCAGQ